MFTDTVGTSSGKSRLWGTMKGKYPVSLINTFQEKRPWGEPVDLRNPKKRACQTWVQGRTGSNLSWLGSGMRPWANTILFSGGTNRLTWLKIILKYSGPQWQPFNLAKLSHSRGIQEKKGSQPTTPHKRQRENYFSCSTVAGDQDMTLPGHPARSRAYRWDPGKTSQSQTPVSIPAKVSWPRSLPAEPGERGR